MKETRIIMGMPITVEITGTIAREPIEAVFDYFTEIDNKYSPYKEKSEVSRINKGLPKKRWSREMREIFGLCEATKKDTNGYFDIVRNGRIDPSGLVKGWAINNAAALLRGQGTQKFYIEAGGDIQVGGGNDKDNTWKVGIRNPFNTQEIIKVVRLGDEGIATSGTYIRGEHIYNPISSKKIKNSLKSLTIIADNVYEADRFSTAAFAMGEDGIRFIELQPGLEGYAVNDQQIATYTSGFERYVTNA